MAHRVNSVHSTRLQAGCQLTNVFLAKSLTLTSHRFLVYATNIPLSLVYTQKTKKNKKIQPKIKKGIVSNP